MVEVRIIIGWLHLSPHRVVEALDPMSLCHLCSLVVEAFAFPGIALVVGSCSPRLYLRVSLAVEALSVALVPTRLMVLFPMWSMQMSSPGLLHLSYPRGG